MGMRKGGILTRLKLGILFIHAYTKYLRKTGYHSQYYPMTPQSAVAYRWKLRPTGPFHNKSTQTLLVKVIFPPQNDPNLTQIGAKLKENVLGRGECPDRRNPNLIVTNISRMIRVAQFR